MKKLAGQLVLLGIVCAICFYLLSAKLGVSIWGEGGIIASILALFLGSKAASKRVELNKKLVTATKEDKVILAEQQRRYEQQSEEVKQAIQVAQDANRQIEQITVVISGKAKDLELERQKLAQQIQEQDLSVKAAEEYLRRSINEDTK